MVLHVECSSLDGCGKIQIDYYSGGSTGGSTRTGLHLHVIRRFDSDYLSVLKIGGIRASQESV